MRLHNRSCQSVLTTCFRPSDVHRVRAHDQLGVSGFASGQSAMRHERTLPAYTKADPSAGGSPGTAIDPFGLLPATSVTATKIGGSATSSARWPQASAAKRKRPSRGQGRGAAGPAGKLRGWPTRPKVITALEGGFVLCRPRPDRLEDRTPTDHKSGPARPNVRTRLGGTAARRRAGATSDGPAPRGHYRPNRESPEGG